MNYLINEAQFTLPDAEVQDTSINILKFAKLGTTLVVSRSPLADGESLQSNFEGQFDETIIMLEKNGFKKPDAIALTNIFSRNVDYWLEWNMLHKFNSTNPHTVHAIYTGIATFLAFMAFGIIPLLPFILLGTNTKYSFEFSAISTFTALVLLGILKWQVVGRGLLVSVTEIVLIGGLAATVAYIVGRMF